MDCLVEATVTDNTNQSRRTYVKDQRLVLELVTLKIVSTREKHVFLDRFSMISCQVLRYVGFYIE